MDFDYRLLAKYLMDSLSLEEMEKVEEWRAFSPENENIYERLEKLRVSWLLVQYSDPEHVEKALGRLNTRIDSRRMFRLSRSVMRYAAMILLLVSFSYMGWEWLKPENYVTITVKEGENVKKVGLADGSIVWLKSGASLRIPESFTINNRKLSLQGEAFFDVAKNALSPLYVSTNYVNIKVLGTAFNVKTDEKQQNVETVLARGKIALLDKQGKDLLIMSPGEKVTYNSDKNEYATEVVDVNICTAWRLNQFVFENVTLREIANQLSVKFNVNINLESSKLARRKFRCVINGDESLSDVLELLRYLGSLRYQVEGREVFIYEQ